MSENPNHMLYEIMLMCPYFVGGELGYTRNIIRGFLPKYKAEEIKKTYLMKYNEMMCVVLSLENIPLRKFNINKLYVESMKITKICGCNNCPGDLVEACARAK
jgi:hypothetical protein